MVLKHLNSFLCNYFVHFFKNCLGLILNHKAFGCFKVCIFVVHSYLVNLNFMGRCILPEIPGNRLCEVNVATFGQCILAL